MLTKIVDFLRNPVFHKDANTAFGYRCREYLNLLGLALLFSVLLGSLIDVSFELLDLDLGNHAMDNWVTDYSVYRIVLFAIILAPLFEEIIFRGPLSWFKTKTYFGPIFYFSIISFGLVHLANYENIENNYWLAPVLVAPQLSMGIFLGYIRVKFGLLWSILLHAGYNLVLTSPLLIMKFFDIPMQ